MPHISKPSAVCLTTATISPAQTLVHKEGDGVDKNLMKVYQGE
jgi:hypothetical protein